jgi:hypothetical protein
VSGYIRRRDYRQFTAFRSEDCLINPGLYRHSGSPDCIASQVAGFAVDPFDAP